MWEEKTRKPSTKWKGNPLNGGINDISDEGLASKIYNTHRAQEWKAKNPIKNGQRPD